MTKRSKSPRPRPQGYDFGVEAHALYVGGLGFIESLNASTVRGCAYGLSFSRRLRAEVPLVSLIARNEAPLVAAFEDFEKWSEESGTQALDLTFVFLSDGGYLLGVAPRMECLARRFSPGKSAVSPILFSGTWVKLLNSRQPAVDQLRTHCEGSVLAPFLFHGCTVQDLGDSVLSDPDSLHPVPGVEPQLIFRATFADEATINEEDHNQAAVVLATFRHSEKDTPRKPRKPFAGPPPAVHPSDFHRRRSNVLETHFPMTLERLRRFDSHRDVISALESEGLERWQIEQAVCNLVLSSMSCNEALHYSPVRHGHLAQHITAALEDRFEEADGVNPLGNQINEEVVREQVSLDATALLTAIGKPPRGADLTVLQRLLAKHGFLGEPLDE